MATEAMIELVNPESLMKVARTTLVLDELPARIETPEQSAFVVECVRRAEAGVAAIKKIFAAPKKDADKAHKSICAAERESIAPGETFARHGRALLADFARREREKAEAEERARIEADRKAEEERRLADAEALAQLAQETGDESYAELADQVIEAAPLVSPEPVVAKANLGAGASASTRSKLVVRSVRALCAQIANGTLPAEIVDVNGPELAKYVKGSGRVPAGVERVPVDTVVIGKGK